MMSPRQIHYLALLLLTSLVLTPLPLQAAPFSASTWVPHHGPNAPLSTVPASLPAINPIHSTRDVASIFGLRQGASRHAIHLLDDGPADTITPTNSISVTTYHNDNGRTGQNLQETILTTSNVTQTMFGKLFSHALDGEALGQPLYVPHVLIHGVRHDVVFVATSHDSVYAFDADQGSVTAPLWQAKLLPAGALDEKIGIRGTPVIDTNSGTLYAIALSKDSGITVTQRLHALDITTGHEKAGSPVVISAPGFDPALQHERPGLLLVNGVVYAGWGAAIEPGSTYHGWIFGYNATTLAQVTVLNTTPTGLYGGVWQSGGGLSADSAGALYVGTGNGTFDANTGGSDYGDTILKLTLTSGRLVVSSYFTPFNQACLYSNDLDLGSSDELLLPDQTGTSHPHEMITAGKEGRIYLVDRDKLGGYTTISNACNNQNLTTVDQVVQESGPGALPGLFSPPVYWQTPNGVQLIYMAGARDSTGTGTVTQPINAYQLNHGLLNLTPVARSPESFNYPGAGLSISSHGHTSGTGILWALEASASRTTGPGILHAYDATDISHELYNSQQNATRDGLDSYVRFSVPTVANGHVYVATKTQLVVYGLLAAGASAQTP